MEKVQPHTHNGTDAPQIEFTDLAILAEAAIAAPTGGMTVDAEARAVITLILTALRNKKLIK